MSLFTERVTLHYRGEVTGTDDYGNDVTAPARDVPNVPCWYEPRESGEDTAAREQVVSGMWLFLPGGTALSALDGATVGGLRYEVAGEPGRTPAGFTIPGLVKVALERVTG